MCIIDYISLHVFIMFSLIWCIFAKVSKSIFSHSRDTRVIPFTFQNKCSSLFHPGRDLINVMGLVASMSKDVNWHVYFWFLISCRTQLHRQQIGLRAPL